MRQVPTQVRRAPLAPPPEHSAPLPPRLRQHAPQRAPLQPAIRYSSEPWHTGPQPAPQPRQRVRWPRAGSPAHEDQPRPGVRRAGCDAPPDVGSLPASTQEYQNHVVNSQMALGEDSPIYSKPDSLLLQHNRCKLLAGGHENSCGRPDIPGTEEKQVAEKKKCAKKHLSQRQPARAWSERSAFLCSQSIGNHVLLRCTLCYR